METIKEIKLSGKSTNFTWIKSKYDEGKLYINGVRIESEDDWNLLRTAIRVTNDIYEGAWDLDFMTDSAGKINLRGIVLHFPHITITNRDSASHNIKDLFVKIHIALNTGERGNKRLKIHNLDGGRSTMTYAEYCSNYLHSHLSTYTYDRNMRRDGFMLPFYNQFCTGSGEINLYQSNINADGLTEERFTQYMLQIMSLVGYESIEGHPYRKIRDIMIRTKTNRGYSLPSIVERHNFINGILRKHRELGVIPDINFVLENGKYVILDDDKWNEFLKTGVTDINSKKKWLVFNDAISYERTEEISEYLVPVLSTEEYIFRDKVFKHVIEDIPKKEEAKEDRVYNIHSLVRATIKIKIENDIDKWKIRKSTIDRYTDKSDNVTESVRSN